MYAFAKFIKEALKYEMKKFPKVLLLLPVSVIHGIVCIAARLHLPYSKNLHVGTYSCANSA